MTSHLEKPTVKRRTIWMTDQEWAQLTAYAKENARNVSEIIRDFWRSASNHPDPAVYGLPDLQGAVRADVRGTHRKREASTSGVDGSGTHGQPDTTRPFLAFSPAPKPTRKSK